MWRKKRKQLTGCVTPLKADIHWLKEEDFWLSLSHHSQTQPQFHLPSTYQVHGKILFFLSLSVSLESQFCEKLEKIYKLYIYKVHSPLSLKYNQGFFWRFTERDFTRLKTSLPLTLASYIQFFLLFLPFFLRARASFFIYYFCKIKDLSNGIFNSIDFLFLSNFDFISMISGNIYEQIYKLQVYIKVHKN